MKIEHAPLRKCDSFGCGHYLAPRGSRQHIGTDFAVAPGTEIEASFKGVITKLGYCYGDHPEYRYVEVAADGYKYRYFYVEPAVAVGEKVERGHALGTAQALNRIYPGITEHCHFEIKDSKGRHHDPMPVILALRGIGE